jgi:hypothetical protein
MTELGDLFVGAKEFGAFEVFLPLLLVFTVVYALLRRIKLFGTGKQGNSIDLVVAGLIAFLVIGYTSPGVAFAAYIGSVFTDTSLIIVTLLAGMMILYVLGKLVGIDIPLTQAGAKKWAILLIALLLVVSLGVFVSSGGTVFFPGLTLPGVTLPEFSMPVLPSIGFTTAHLAVLVMGGALALVAWYISTKPEG